MPDTADLEEMLANLERGAAATPWTLRRVWAANLGEALGKPERRNIAHRLIVLLANDSKWEVRKEVATLLPLLSDNEFAPLAAKLTVDSNGFVRKTAERALELRRKGTRDMGPRRKGLDQVIAQFDQLGTIHGKAARDNALALAMRLYEFSVAEIVHDLRGVLTSARAQLDQVQKGSASPKALQDGLGKVARNLVYLEKFVDAMGAYSQAVPLERALVRLAHVVNDAHGIAVDAAYSVRPEATRVSASISVEQDVRVMAAQHQLVAAVANVLKNALEAVLCIDDGRVPEVGLIAEIPRGRDLHIVVRDNGMGIAESDLQQLRAFVPGRTTKKGYGTGFGLPIAQRYIAAHGGSISIESVQDVGTTVTIILPIESQEE